MLLGIFCLSLIAPLSLTMQSCQNDEDEPIEDNQYMLNNVEGVVEYNDRIGEWYILVSVKGSIDGREAYFPDALPDEFKQAETEVIFSGNYREIEFDTFVFGVCTECYELHLKSIRKK